MKYVLFTVFVAVSFVGPAFGSENPIVVHTFHVSVGTLNSNPLRYCDNKYIDSLNKDYGMGCEYNEPFLWVERQGWLPKDRQKLSEQYIDPITLVPFKYFLVGDTLTLTDDDKFKECKNSLFSFSTIIDQKQHKFELILDSDFEEKPPKDLLDQFRKEYVQCMPGHLYDEKHKLLAVSDASGVEEEKCGAGIICKVEGQSAYVQGPNGLFGEEIKAEQKVQEQALLYSRLKKLFGCSVAIIIMYALYKKFYNVAG